MHMSVHRFQLELVFAFVGHRSRRGLGFDPQEGRHLQTALRSVVAEVQVLQGPSV